MGKEKERYTIINYLNTLKISAIMTTYFGFVIEQASVCDWSIYRYNRSVFTYTPHNSYFYGPEVALSEEESVNPCYDHGDMRTAMYKALAAHGWPALACGIERELQDNMSVTLLKELRMLTQKYCCDDELT